MMNQKISFFFFVIIISTIFSCKDANESNYCVYDVDGNKYHSVTIGTQTWMVENLNTTKYRDGSSIKMIENNLEWSNQTSGACCNYNNDINFGKKYGKLYNWYAVVDYHNLAPEGWHVATDNDWEILSNYLGGFRVAGGKLKKKGTSNWLTPNSFATNESGFSALPGALRFDGGMYYYQSMFGVWWSIDAYDNNYAWARYTIYNSAYIIRSNEKKGYGFSVRCVKDSI